MKKIVYSKIKSIFDLFFFSHILELILCSIFTYSYTNPLFMFAYTDLYIINTINTFFFIIQTSSLPRSRRHKLGMAVLFNLWNDDEKNRFVNIFCNNYFNKSYFYQNSLRKYLIIYTGCSTNLSLCSNYLNQNK